MVTLRPARPEDRERLLAIYASTRADELAPVPWTEEQKASFLRMQFEAQDTDYRRNYPDAEYSVVEVDGSLAGRLYVHRRPDEIRLIDIALLPAFRGRGIGTGLLTRLFDEAASRDVPITIHVEISNPARSLYERLGFVAEGEQGLYVLMRWTPAARRAVVS
jgi:ribosomal protein S18 acetylase RimI-like enzyme